MFEKIAGQMNPKTIRTIKIATIVVCVAAGAVVAGVVAYKLGVIGQAEVVEEIVETAVQTA